MSDWNDRIIEEFRANEGRVGRFGNGHLVLLTTTGAKSGLKRISPLLAVERPNPFGSIYVIAAYAGAPVNPAWYHNILGDAGGLRRAGDRQRHRVVRRHCRCTPPRRA